MWNDLPGFLCLLGAILHGYLSHAQSIESLSILDQSPCYKQAQIVIRNYYSHLRLISRESDKRAASYEAIALETYFTDNKVLVYNDLDPENSFVREFEAYVYLQNIRSWLKEGAQFKRLDFDASPVFISKDTSFLFMKMTVVRSLNARDKTGKRIANRDTLDFYLRIEKEDFARNFCQLKISEVKAASMSHIAHEVLNLSDVSWLAVNKRRFKDLKTHYLGHIIQTAMEERQFLIADQNLNRMKELSTDWRLVRDLENKLKQEVRAHYRTLLKRILYEKRYEKLNWLVHEIDRLLPEDTLYKKEVEQKILVEREKNTAFFYKLLEECKVQASGKLLDTLKLLGVDPSKRKELNQERKENEVYCLEKQIETNWSDGQYHKVANLYDTLSRITKKDHYKLKKKERFVNAYQKSMKEAVLIDQWRYHDRKQTFKKAWLLMDALDNQSKRKEPEKKLSTVYYFESAGYYRDGKRYKREKDVVSALESLYTARDSIQAYVRSDFFFEKKKYKFDSLMTNIEALIEHQEAWLKKKRGRISLIKYRNQKRIAARKTFRIGLTYNLFKIHQSVLEYRAEDYWNDKHQLNADFRSQTEGTNYADFNISIFYGLFGLYGNNITAPYETLQVGGYLKIWRLIYIKAGFDKVASMNSIPDSSDFYGYQYTATGALNYTDLPLQVGLTVLAPLHHYELGYNFTTQAITFGMGIHIGFRTKKYKDAKKELKEERKKRNEKTLEDEISYL